MKNIVRGTIIAILAYTTLNASDYDSLNVSFLGNWPYGYSWAVSADTLMNIGFSGSGGAVLLIDLSTMEQLSDIRTRGRVLDIFSDPLDSILYIAADSRGVEIWDVSDPTNPTRLSSYQTPGTPYGVFKDQNNPYLYVADGDNQLLILDVSDPTNPVQIGHGFSGSTPIFAKDVYAKDGYVYLVGRPILGGALRVFNVSNPAAPLQVASAFDVARFTDITIQDTLALISAYPFATYGGVYIVNISNPLSPQLLSIADTLMPYEGEYTGAALLGNTLFAAKSNTLVVLDLSDPLNPVMLNDSTGIPAYKVFQMGNIFTAGLEKGFRMVQVSDPSSPVVVGAFDAHDETGPNITQTSGLWVLDTTYAFLSYQGLTILDISNPSYPVCVANDTSMSVADIDLSPPYAYTVGGQSFQILDISDPTNPQKIGAYSTTDSNESFVSVDVQGTYAYVGTYNHGLRILDISDPTSPSEVGEYTPSSPYPIDFVDVKVRGNYVYIAHRFESKIRVVDVSDPTSPVEVSTVYLGATPNELFLTDTYLYAAGTNGGIYIVDLSDPGNPQLVTNFDQTAAWAIHGSGQFLYVSNAYDGISVVDISNPTEPQLVGYYETPTFVNGVFSNGKYIYATCGFGGSAFQIYENLSWVSASETSPPSASSNVRLYPTLSGNLVLIVPSPMRLFVNIYDVTGRSLLSLDRFFTPGKHTLKFAPTTKGVYFYTIRAQNSTSSTVVQKFILLK